MINARGLLILVIMILAFTAVRARADDLPPKWVCDEVIKAVKQHGKIRATIIALAEGFTPSQINEARKCLRQH